jgi:hypothetical protein
VTFPETVTIGCGASAKFAVNAPRSGTVTATLWLG